MRGALRTRRSYHIGGSDEFFGRPCKMRSAWCERDETCRRVTAPEGAMTTRRCARVVRALVTDRADENRAKGCAGQLYAALRGPLADDTAKKTPANHSHYDLSNVVINGS